MIDLEVIRWGHDNLVPVIVQADDGRVLMLAYANRQALEKTIETGLMHFWSRSRQALWQKGETSGHKQRVISLALDCDNDTILAQVEQTGPACHTGTSTCFGEVQPPIFSQLWSVFERRQTDQPKNSYVNKLLSEPRRLRQKIGEEGIEVALAEGKEELIYEAGDLIFHLSVLLFYHGLKWQDVERELQKRRK